MKCSAVTGCEVEFVPYYIYDLLPLLTCCVENQTDGLPLLKLCVISSHSVLQVSITGMQSLIQHWLLVCVRACACARVCACVCVRAHACACACVRACVCLLVRQIEINTEFVTSLQYSGYLIAILMTPMLLPVLSISIQNQIPFVDPSFCPAPSSLYRRPRESTNPLVAAWRRPCNIVDQHASLLQRGPWTVFHSPPDGSDIVQGRLGDCW